MVRWLRNGWAAMWRFPLAGSASAREDRADLDGDPPAVYAGPRAGDLHGIVDRVGLERRVAAENLSRLHERAVGHPGGPDRPSLVGRVELVAAVHELS